MRMSITQHAHISHPLSLACRSLLILLTLSLLASRLAAQSDQEIKSTPALELGNPVERDLAGGQTHTYRIALDSGQYVHLIVDQRGIDVVVTLFSPAGKQILEVDSPNGTQGPELIFALAETSGNYRLEVHSLEKDIPAGRYVVTVQELRIATEQDNNRIAAEKGFKEAELLRGQGTADSLQSSLKKYEEVLPLYHNMGDRSREAVTLTNIGLVCHALGQMRRALDSYEQALLLYRANGDRRDEAVTLNKIGLVYGDLGETQKALEYYQQALQLRRTVSDREGEAITLDNIGGIYDLLGEKQKALDYYQQALSLRRAIGDREGEATTLNNIGLVYDSLGEKQKALDYYGQALPLSRAAGDRYSEAAGLSNIGAVYVSLGEKQKALGYYGQALPLLRAVGDRRGESEIHTNLGVIYYSLGESQKALDYYGQALSYHRAVGNRRNEAITLNNISMIYDSLGEKQKALDYLTQSLPLRRAVSDRSGEAVTLNNIGLIYNSLGEKQKALDYYAQALPLRRAIGDRDGEAVTLNNIGGAYKDLGEKQKALDYFSQSLPLYRAVGNREGEATTLKNIGEVYESLGQKRKASDYYAQALPLARASGDRRSEAQILYDVASLARKNGNLSEALTNIKAALAIVEILRTNIARQELRSSYFSTVQNYYELYIDVMMRLHKERPSGEWNAAALQASEGARARSLLDLLNEARADIRQGVDPALLQQARSLQHLLNGKAELRARLLNRPHTAEQATAAAKEIEALTLEYNELETKIRQTSPRYAALTQPEPLRLKAIQKELDSSTLLLEYSLGDERSYLWLVSPTDVKSFELPSRREIETAARQFHEFLTQPNHIYSVSGQQRPTPPDAQQREMMETASRLSRMLLGPVASELGYRRLVIVADGALQYIPFAALPDVVPAEAKGVEAQPLIVQHEIVSLPSISILPMLRSEMVVRKPADKGVAILADPVFDAGDERVKRTSARKGGSESVQSVSTDGSRLPRLKGTRKEAEGILALMPTGKSKVALDFDASRAFISGEDLSQYRYVHFATHGLLDSTHPELSSVVLSLVDENGDAKNGYLRLNEVYNLHLPADLVVLSGCQTALGKEIKGEGLIGLTRGFIYAGSARIVASLWRADDEATAELMVRFYKKMIREGQKPSGALRAAQIEMMKQQRWRAPHYWATFVFQGEWR